MYAAVSWALTLAFVGCGVFDPQGDRVGKVVDVLMAYRKTVAPRATGFIIEISGRRRVFLPITRVTAIAPGQVITNGLIDLRRFSQRGQEVRAIAEILGRKVTLLADKKTATIEDFAIEKNKRGEWIQTELFVRRPKSTALPFAKGPTEFVLWQDVAENREDPQDQDAQQPKEIELALYTTDCGMPKSAISNDAVPLQVKAYSDPTAASTSEQSSITRLPGSCPYGQLSRTEAARTT